MKTRLSDGTPVLVADSLNPDGTVSVTFPLAPDRNNQYPFDGKYVVIDHERLELK